MLLWTVVCSCLLLGVSSAYELDTFEYLVNLVNGLFIDSKLSFSYDFGSGVPLLQGKASVSLHPPLLLLPNSTVSYPNLYYTQLCSLKLKVLGKITVFQENPCNFDLVLHGCHIELDVGYNNKSACRVVPHRVWLHNCSSVELCNEEVPKASDQVLPMISEAMYVIAKKKFSEEYSREEDIKTDISKSFEILKDMFPLLMVLKGRPIVSQFEDII